MNIASPCTGICQLDGAEMCVGCGRTGDEIARWTQMSDAEKTCVRSTLGARRKTPTMPDHELAAT